MGAVQEGAAVTDRIPLGRIHVDPVDLAGALARIEALVEAGHGGFVATPNVDHVVRAETDAGLRVAYRHADLSLVDGMPLVWLAALAGTPVPEKVSGSDLIRPLMERAAERGWRVYFFGGAPGVGEEAARILTAEYPGLDIAGMDAPPLGFEQDPRIMRPAIERLRQARPHLVLVALGCPKQELLMERIRDRIAPAVALGIGAGLDFIAGTRRRAPAWMSQIGLEWLYRLVQEPRRMAGRYLVRDARIVLIASRTLWRAWRRMVRQALAQRGSDPS